MGSKMDLNQTLYFVAVVEYGSFTKAAEHLNIPKSTLSRNIQALESNLNLRLLNRSTRKLSLTKAGETYFNSCLPMIQGLQKAQGQILDYQQDIQGQLKVTMPTEVGMSFLADILPEFMLRYPKIKLEIDFSTQNHNLIAAGFDLAIRINNQQLEDSSYIAKRIASPSLGLYASPSYLQKHRPIHKLEDLNEHTHILVTATKGVLKIENQQPFLRERFQLTSNSMAFNKTLSMQGMGIVLLPKILCQHEVETRALIQLLPNLAIERPIMYAIYPSRKHPSKALKTFIEFIENKLKRFEKLL